ncbi:TIGR03943 family protein, partial [Micromonospora sp. NPDC048999]
TCCAADGIPIKIGLSGDVPDLPADTWVRATGRYTPDTAQDPFNGSDIPYFEVDSWKKIPQPKNPYE